MAQLLEKDERILIVGSAPDGQKAFCCASTFEPELVLTDLHMPKLDGAEIARLLKRLPNTPVVFVATSDDSPDSRVRCLAAGVVFFFGSNEFHCRNDRKFL
jgi:CheY-like chemotaxis protein